MRLYERALPEMLRFRDSGEIMYEVPLCSTDPFPSKPASADFLTGKSPVSLRTIRQADEKARKKGGERGGRRGKKGKGKGRRGTSRTDKQFSENVPRKSAATDFPLYFSLFATLSSFPSFLFD